MVKFLVLFLLTLSCGCAVSTQIPLQENTSNKLRVDGFYYSILENEGEFIASIHFLYKNGVRLYQGSKSFSSQNELIDVIVNNSEKESWIFASGPKAKEMFGLWGSYWIENDNFYTIRQQLGRGKLYLESRGKVLNEESFEINERKVNKILLKTDIPRANDKYYFVPTISKPDSTNNFFK